MAKIRMANMTRSPICSHTAPGMINYPALLFQGLKIVFEKVERTKLCFFDHTCMSGARAFNIDFNTTCKPERNESSIIRLVNSLLASIPQLSKIE